MVLNNYTVVIRSAHYAGAMTQRRAPSLALTALISVLALIGSTVPATARPVAGPITMGVQTGPPATVDPLSGSVTGRDAMPSKAQWVDDVATAMKGSRVWLDRRVAKNNKRDKPRKLALNLDIDNSAIASFYDFPHATPYVIRLARRAHNKGVAVLFNTARLGSALSSARTLLTKAGYTVDGLCGRSSSATGVAAGKKACRTKFRSQGYVLIGNVGNRPTDFEGGGYWRAFRLPNYDLRLG